MRLVLRGTDLARAVSILAGLPFIVQSLGDWTLNEEGEEGSYEIDTFAILAGLFSAFITFVIASFIDTEPSLSAKAGLELDIEGVALGFAAFFALVLYFQYHRVVFSFNKSPNLAAIGVGMIGLAPLILIQVAVGRLVPGSTATVQVNTGLDALFYASAAVNETFLFQAVFYTVLAQVIAGLDEDIGWKEFFLAGVVVVPAMAGYLHYAVYNGSLPAILSVAMDFTFLNFLYQVTGTLTAPMVGHLSLNLVSSTVGSIFPLVLAGVNVTAMAPFLGAFLVVIIVMVAYRGRRIPRLGFGVNLNSEANKGGTTLASKAPRMLGCRSE